MRASMSQALDPELGDLARRRRLPMSGRWWGEESRPQRRSRPVRRRTTTSWATTRSGRREESAAVRSIARADVVPMPNRSAMTPVACATSTRCSIASRSRSTLCPAPFDPPSHSSGRRARSRPRDRPVAHRQGIGRRVEPSVEPGVEPGVGRLSIDPTSPTVLTITFIGVNAGALGLGAAARDLAAVARGAACEIRGRAPQVRRCGTARVAVGRHRQARGEGSHGDPHGSPRLLDEAARLPSQDLLRERLRGDESRPQRTFPGPRGDESDGAPRRFEELDGRAGEAERVDAELGEPLRHLSGRAFGPARVVDEGRHGDPAGCDVGICTGHESSRARGALPGARAER